MPSFAEEVANVAREMGVAGDDEIGYVESGYDEVEGEYEVGAAKKRKLLGRNAGRVPVTEGRGIMGVWTMPATAAVTLAAAAVGNLVFTPNRNISIIDVMLDAYVAAAAAAAFAPAAIKITNITVQGRPQWPGAGEVPLSVFRPLNPGRNKPLFNYGNCDASQSVVISLRNDDAATQHIVSGALRVVCIM